MFRFRALASSLLVGVAFSVAGCTAPEPAPKVPFGEFEIGQFGGVAGRQNILHVRPDGLALLVSNQPAAGRLSPSRLDRLRTLLESEGLRREVAAAADAERKPPRCADLFSTSVVMGSLRMSVEERCGSETRPATPAFDEIISLTAPAMAGNFDGPVDVLDPRLVGLQLERPAYGDHTAFTVTVDPDGHGTLAYAGTVRRRLLLEPADRDVLRLLVGRLMEEPTQPCLPTQKTYYRLLITAAPASSGPDCSYRDRAREFYAVAQLLQRALDVEV